MGAGTRGGGQERGGEEEESFGDRRDWECLNWSHTFRHTSSTFCLQNVVTRMQKYACRRVVCARWRVGEFAGSVALLGPARFGFANKVLLSVNGR